jgi:hypothetical protein
VAHGLALVFSRIWRADLQEPEFNPMAGVITKLTLVDVTNPESPQLVRETFIEGDFLDARMVDNRVHLITSSPIESNHQGDIPPSADDPTINNAAAFFPHYFTRSGQDGSATGSSAPVCTCENTFYPTIPRGLNLLTLFTLDLGDPETEMKSVSIIGDPGQIYGSGESIYIASSADHLWMWWSIDVAGEKEVRETTVLHRFDIQGSSPVYAASGEVPGSVLNQFSMSEHEGLFRLATTEGGWWSDVISNRVFLLRQEEDRLQEISRLENLGKPGERIFAVRFLGHRGYVVTFEQVDPLYVLDLADPEAPRVTGELEVPGFSTYLHPAGEEMLLAVGRDGGQVNLSLFDVSDPADPKLVHRLATGLYSWSEAEYEHKAFTYFAGRGILAVPITAWIENSADSEQGTMFNGLHLYGVNLSASQNDAFSLLGTVDHASFYLDEEQDYWFFPASVRRSFFIGDPDGGDFLYSVSDRGMKINALADLAEVAALSIPAAPYWGEVAPMMGLAIAE